MKYCYKYVLLLLFTFCVFNINAKAQIKKIHPSYDISIFINDDGSANVIEKFKTDSNNNVENREIGYFSNTSISINSVKNGSGVIFENNVYDGKSRGDFYYTFEEPNVFYINFYNPKDDYVILDYTINNLIYNTGDNIQVMDLTLLKGESFRGNAYVNISISSNKELNKNMFLNDYDTHWNVTFQNNTINLKYKNLSKLLSNAELILRFPEGYFNTDNKVNVNYKNIGISTFCKNFNKVVPVVSIIFFLIFYFTLIFIIFFVLYFLVEFSTFTYWKRRKSYYKYIRKYKLPSKDVPIFRDLIFKDDIHLAFLVGCNYNIIKNENDYFGALILKWILNKNVERELKW